MSKLKRSLLLVLCVFLLGGGLAACSSNNNGEQAAPSNNVSENNQNQNQDTEGPKDGGTLTLSTISDIVSLNPLFIQDTASSDAAHWVFAKLYDLNREGLVTAEPWSIAAEEPIISEDGLTYTVKLKDYAKWSDGTPITTDDIIFTIETIMNPDTGSPAISTFDKIESINKISDYEIEFKLSRVYAPFIYSLVFEPGAEACSGRCAS